MYSLYFPSFCPDPLNFQLSVDVPESQDDPDGSMLASAGVNFWSFESNCGGAKSQDASWLVFFLCYPCWSEYINCTVHYLILMTCRGGDHVPFLFPEFMFMTQNPYLMDVRFEGFSILSPQFLFVRVRMRCCCAQCKVSASIWLEHALFSLLVDSSVSTGWVKRKITLNMIFSIGRQAVTHTGLW